MKNHKTFHFLMSLLLRESGQLTEGQGTMQLLLYISQQHPSVSSLHLRVEGREAGRHFVIGKNCNTQGEGSRRDKEVQCAISSRPRLHHCQVKCFSLDQLVFPSLGMAPCLAPGPCLCSAPIPVRAGGCWGAVTRCLENCRALHSFRLFPMV